MQAGEDSINKRKREEPLTAPPSQLAASGSPFAPPAEKKQRTYESTGSNEDWGCLACTFMNPNSTRVCGMCGGASPNSISPPAVSQASNCETLEERNPKKAKKNPSETIKRGGKEEDEVLSTSLLYLADDVCGSWANHLPTLLGGLKDKLAPEQLFSQRKGDSCKVQGAGPGYPYDRWVSFHHKKLAGMVRGCEERGGTGVILVIGYSFACRGLTFVLARLLEELGTERRKHVLSRLRFVQLHPPLGKKADFSSKQEGEEANRQDSDWMASYSLIPEVSLMIVSPDAALNQNINIVVDGRFGVKKNRRQALREASKENLVCISGTTRSTFESAKAKKKTRKKSTEQITGEVVAAIAAHANS